MVIAHNKCNSELTLENLSQFHVDLSGTGSPKVTLQKTKECHVGPVFAMQVFPDGFCRIC